MSRKEKHSDLREACIIEAMQIIETSGLENLSFREVARRLGVSHQAPYKHFPSRDHILAEIVRRSYQDFAQHLESRPITGDPYADLESLGRAYLGYALDNPLQYRLMFATPLPSTAEHPEMMQGAQIAFDHLCQLIVQMRLATNPSYDALFVWSSIHGLATLLQAQVMEKLAISDEILEQAVEQVLLRIKNSL
jgi:AcrR family transcriptional regulator